MCLGCAFEYSETEPNEFRHEARSMRKGEELCVLCSHASRVSGNAFSSSVSQTTCMASTNSSLFVRVLLVYKTDEESNSAANSNVRKFLYNSKGLDVISLLVKYYVPLAHFNKVIKLLKFKSAVNLQCF